MKNKFFLLPWKWKLTFALSTCIFLTYSIFSFFQYQTVSSWLIKQEENDVEQTMNEIHATLKKNEANFLEKDIESNELLMDISNEENQLVRIIAANGDVLLSNKNGDMPVLETGLSLPENKFSYFTVGEQRSLVYSESFEGKTFHGKIEIIRLLDSYTNVMMHLEFAMILFAIFAILISGIIGYVISIQLLKPLRVMTQTIKKIKRKGFKERMPIYPQKDEISELSILFNEMMDRIDYSFQQQKQFVEDASHELRTPISILEGHISMLNRWGKNNPAILEESLHASVEEVAKLKNLVLSLLDLTKIDHHHSEKNLQPISVKEILDQTVKDFQMLHTEFVFYQNIQCEKLTGISEQHFQQILTILLDNAIKYSKEMQEVNITTYKTNKKFILVVEDKGIGVPEDELSNVFDRFYRVDKARSRVEGGTGLGLSIAKKIVEYHSGTIHMESKLGYGSKVIVALPNSN